MARRRQYLQVLFGMVCVSLAPRRAIADVTTCQRAIALASARYVQGRAKAFQRCDDAKLRGRLRPTTACTDDPSTAAVLSDLEVKLVSGIEQSCGGRDGICGTADDDPLGAIGWGTLTCPDFARAGCTRAIASCTDVAYCLECIADEAVGRTLALYYEAFDSAEFRTDSVVNRCQRIIGSAAVKYLNARSKALQRCWDARLRGAHANPCPDPGDGRTTALLDKAEARKRKTICKACGGFDGLCNGADDLAVADIGSAASCPEVETFDGRSCDAHVTDVGDLADCIECVTDHAVDCADAAGVPALTSVLPIVCNPVPTTPSSSTTTSTSRPTTTSIATSSSTSTTTSPVSTTTSSTTTSSTSTTTSTMPSTFTCPAGALVDATVGVFYDRVGAPALSGVRLSIGYPAVTSLPNIPSTQFVDPSRLTDLTGMGPFLLARDVDANQDTVEDTVDLVFALTNATFPPGDIVSIQFDCAPGEAMSATDFPCVVTNASDRVGNDLPDPRGIPCDVTGPASP
jgi:hypothetical protein